MMDDFELLGEVTSIEIIVVNLSIWEKQSLKERVGGRRWRKLKGEGKYDFPTAKFAKLSCIGARLTESDVAR
jgi:hypothetical protein